MKTVVLAATGDQWTFHRLPQALAHLGVQPHHVLHVGANIGQEVPDYRRAGIDRITLVEPDPDAAAKLRELHPDLPVIEAACGTAEAGGTLRRVAASVDEHHVWSTLSDKPMPHGQQVADERPVTVFTVAQLQETLGDVDMLVIDTQGTELNVLASADLSTLRLVVIETQEVDRDQHAGYLPDVVAYMAAFGWVPVLRWLHEHPGSSWFGTYGDTFFAPAVTP